MFGGKRLRKPLRAPHWEFCRRPAPGQGKTVGRFAKRRYATILDQIARAAERFLSASVRLKLLRLRPHDSEIATSINDDLSAGWLALEDLGKMLAADQLICSDKVLALVSEANSDQFWNAESLFRLYGYSAIDIDDLHKHTQDLFTKLRHRCRREAGLR